MSEYLEPCGPDCTARGIVTDTAGMEHDDCPPPRPYGSCPVCGGSPEECLDHEEYDDD